MTLLLPLWIISAMAEIGSLSGLEISHGPDNIIIATEEEAALRCVVQGFPLPTVHWFKNSQPLQIDSHRSLQNSGQLLFFKNVSEEDEGFYYCEAKNAGKTVRSKMAFLLPAVMEWNFIQQPNNVTAMRGNSVTLTCRPPRSRPDAVVSWFKNNRLINSMPHFSLQPNGDLLFHSVQDKDRGIYFCRASNTHLSRAVSSRKVFLNVLDPPSVEIWPVVETVPLGSEVRFQCHVSGNPTPSITWSKQGWSMLTGGKVITGVRNATLYISSVKSYDEGFYTCEASNVVGHARGTASLRLIVPPAVQSLQPVMESKLSLFPSLNVDWTSSWQDDGLKNFKGLVLKTDKLSGNKPFSVETHTKITPPQSSMEVVMSEVYIKLFPTPLLVEAYSLPSNPLSRFHFLLPHSNLHLSPVAQTLFYQFQAHSHEPQSQPIDPHSQPPGHDATPQTLSLSKEVWAAASACKEQSGSKPRGSAKNSETHVTDWPERNTLRYTMRTNDDINRVKSTPSSWLPVLETHDIPIVVGVGVSLAFIFITMAFYSLVQKNEPVPMGRAHRSIGVPHRRTGRPETRTYENRAFEGDKVVVVNEQSPNTRTRALLPASNAVNMVTEPPSNTSPNHGQHTQDQTAISDQDSESKKGQQHMDDWGSEECGKCPMACREEEIHTFLTLQPTEPCTPPVHHSVSISHGSTPLLLSHCVSLGVTTVAVDVHFYPPTHSAAPSFTYTPPGLNNGSQLAQSQESERTAPKVHFVQRTCL